jgi:hypothetical protein
MPILKYFDRFHRHREEEERKQGNSNRDTKSDRYSTIERAMFYFMNKMIGIQEDRDIFTINLSPSLWPNDEDKEDTAALNKTRHAHHAHHVADASIHHPLIRGILQEFAGLSAQLKMDYFTRVSTNTCSQTTTVDAASALTDPSVSTSISMDYCEMGWIWTDFFPDMMDNNQFTLTTNH